MQFAIRLDPSKIEKSVEKKPKEYKGGLYLSPEIVSEEKKKAYEAFPSLMDAFNAKMQFGRLLYEQNMHLMERGFHDDIVGPDAFEDFFWLILQENYFRSVIIGKRSVGNLTSIDKDEADILMPMMLEQRPYLHKFMEDMASKDGSMDYERRMGMYTKSMQDCFWLGFVLGDRDPDRRLTWHYGDTIQHCESCKGFAEHGPYTVDEFIEDIVKPGLLPQSGGLACGGWFCRCFLTDNKSHNQPTWLRKDPIRS